MDEWLLLSPREGYPRVPFVLFAHLGDRARGLRQQLNAEHVSSLGTDASTLNSCSRCVAHFQQIAGPIGDSDLKQADIAALVLGS